MRGFDMTPLLRTSVGFDRLARRLDTLATEQAPSYPPYNIEKLSEDEYTISMAVAGFSEADIEVTVQETQLKIVGKIEPESSGEERRFLHRGIAARSFERSFSLAEHIKVRDAQLENGLLHITLERDVPEEARPKSIPIVSHTTGSAKKLEKKAA